VSSSVLLFIVKAAARQHDGASEQQATAVGAVQLRPDSNMHGPCNAAAVACDA
jgi:hypothetical protein